MLNDYKWADEDYDLSWTVAVVEGKPEDEVIRQYGGNPDKPIGSMTFADTFTLVPDEDLGKYFFAQTLRVDMFVVVLENNGWAGASAELAMRVSEDDGNFFAVQWSPVTSRIVQAVDGALLADFEPLFPPGPNGPGGTFPAWLNEIMFNPESLHSSMMEAMELQTRLAFDSDWLTRTLPVYKVPNPQ